MVGVSKLLPMFDLCRGRVLELCFECMKNQGIFSRIPFGSRPTGFDAIYCPDFVMPSINNH